MEEKNDLYMEMNLKWMTKDFKCCWLCEHFEVDSTGLERDCLKDRDCTKCELARNQALVLYYDGWRKPDSDDTYRRKSADDVRTDFWSTYPCGRNRNF